MKTTINNITYEGTPEELAQLASILAASAVSTAATVQAAERAYRPRPATISKLERYLALSDSTLATIIRQTFTSTPIDNRYFNYIFLKPVAHACKTIVKNLDLSRVDDATLASAARLSIQDSLSSGRASTAVRLLDTYGRRIIGTTIAPTITDRA